MVSFSLGGISAGIANAGVIIVGIQLGLHVWGFGDDLTAGKVLAFAFLVTLFVGPVQMGTQIFTDAQNALVSWRRVIGILETPADLVDPGEDGQVLPRGPIDVSLRDVTFAYPGGPPVLRDIDLDIPAGTRVGRRRRDRLGQVHRRQAAHPADGSVRGRGAARRRRRARDRAGVAAPQRRAGAAGGVPLRRHPRQQRPLRATGGDVRGDPGRCGRARPRATGWPDCRPAWRPASASAGESLSAGERQLVALLRAQLADPDLLVLDEATSSVDPALEMRIGRALERLMTGTHQCHDRAPALDRRERRRGGRGRAGRIVQRGPHAVLVRQEGSVYAGLHASWVSQQSS